MSRRPLLALLLGSLMLLLALVLPAGGAARPVPPLREYGYGQVRYAGHGPEW
jgi:hypothetical protein